MDPYIKARLERMEMYLNNAREYYKVKQKWNQIVMVRANLKAALEQFKKIEKYIHQCGAQAAEDSKYISIIE